MKLARIDDWTALRGIDVEIRREGRTVCRGTVDAVTDDGTILWLQPLSGTRRLFEMTESDEAWAPLDDPGFHYRLANGRAAVGLEGLAQPPLGPNPIEQQ